jgi:hypothetical protein
MYLRVMHRYNVHLISFPLVTVHPLVHFPAKSSDVSIMHFTTMFQTQLYRENGQVTTQYKMTIWRLQNEKLLTTAHQYLQNNSYTTILLITLITRTMTQAVSNATYANNGKEWVILNRLVNYMKHDESKQYHEFNLNR